MIGENKLCSIESYLADPRSYEAVVAEATIQFILSDYYVEQSDIEKGFISENLKAHVMEFAKKKR